MLKHQERVRFCVQGRVATAALEGEIDHHSAQDIRRELDDRIRRARPGVLRLDLSGVTFMDSSGLGLIMGRCALMQQMGGELVLFRPTAAVLRMVMLSGMDRMLKIEN
jgi:stage II sporulation protein AA (anti-sigma F factor antagonist)